MSMQMSPESICIDQLSIAGIPFSSPTHPVSASLGQSRLAPKSFTRNHYLSKFDDMPSLCSAVAFLPDGCADNYNDWLDVLLPLAALKGTVHEDAAYELAQDFSSRSAKFDNDEFDQKWDGLEARDYTPASIFRRAYDLGWKPPVAPKPLRKFQPIRAGDMRLDTSNRYYIKNLIPQVEQITIVGAPGSGKSFLVLDILQHIQTGKTWRGLRVRQAQTMYICCEGGGDVPKRLHALAKAHGIAASDLDISVVNSAVNLTGEGDDVQPLIDAIREVDAKVVVIDTLARAMTGADENSSKDMGVTISHAQTIAQTTGASMLVVHHCGKDTTKGARGSSALLGANDTELLVRGGKGAPRSLYVSKMKDGEEGAEYPFKLKINDLGPDSDGDIITSCSIEHLATVEVDQTRQPTGQWNLRVYAAVQSAVGLGFTVLKSIAKERAIETAPTPEGKDRRKEMANRALGELCDQGFLIDCGDSVRLPAGGTSLAGSFQDLSGGPTTH